MADVDLVRAVTRALSALQVALKSAPAAITGELVEIWTAVLERAGMTAADVERAAGIVASRSVFFPAPTEFVQAVYPPVNEDLEADRAWSVVRTAVRDLGGGASLSTSDVAGDGAALWALSQFGWERLCRELGDDNQAILRAEFLRWYRLGRADHAKADYIVGRLEVENRLAGYELTPARCGRPDWRALPASALASRGGSARDGLAPLPKALPAGGEEALAPVGAALAAGEGEGAE